MSRFADRRWIAPLAALLAVGAVGIGAGTVHTGSGGQGAAAPARIRLHVPSTVDPPLEVWDVAAQSVAPHQGAPAAAFVVEVSALIELPEGARDLRVGIDGSGVFTPQPGSSRQLRWRWAIPLRDKPPPYSIPVTVTARYRYHGKLRQVRRSAAATVQPPQAPRGKIWVSDVPFDYAVDGYGPIRRDHSVSGILTDAKRPIALDGTVYDKGIGTNSRSVLGIFTGASCTRFHAVVGVDDSSGSGGTVTFAVVGDDRTLTQTPVLKGSSPAQTLDVDISGVRQLNLQVGTGGDGQGNDHADWASARLDCA